MRGYGAGVMLFGVASIVSTVVAPEGVAAEGTEDLVSTGGRQFTTVRASLKADEEAAQFYKNVRSNPSNADVKLISKNTGMPEFQVQRIKQHLFFDTHQLSTGVERFSPDIEITDAWMIAER